MRCQVHMIMGAKGLWVEMKWEYISATGIATQPCKTHREGGLDPVTGLSRGSAC